ncbi:hypothetical protein PUNSTDRAFT_58114 [Punctularia strigosozonata HHB-11173 SS5]|uniref:uncharacterized protein n=1 Tax=Punctularia strigosozonata (strain HHB-11173) TaxID=741275 RepID=UPI00044165BF|nr:uncharacterized protein PUNSTDRAFT_58114 [Punctularia strigosozonata HHB-11173 SS5]EIN13998.1 hypothetical protein PUNSTDRAFT_58114 [Punctularia strigosozonata HHB-11173 SS5]
MIPSEGTAPAGPTDLSEATETRAHTARENDGSSAPARRKPHPRKEKGSETAEAVGSAQDATSAKRKRAKKPAGNELGDAEAGADLAKGRPRRSSSTPTSPSRKRGRRGAPSPPPFDADLDPGEELDPTAVTMAALCSDIGVGRVSSKAALIRQNHANWKAASKTERARILAAREAKKYGRPDEDVGIDRPATEDNVDHAGKDTPDEPAAGDPSTSAGVTRQQATSTTSEQDPSDGNFDYDQAVGTSKYNVQVRIGPNGEMVVDEQSLYVDRAEDEDTNMEGYTHVEESDATKFVNSMSYSKKARGSRWSAEETELFFQALQQFGENYELISLILPGRDRKACKNKFKAEDKRNPNRITYCLKNRLPYGTLLGSRR